MLELLICFLKYKDNRQNQNQALKKKIKNKKEQKRAVSISRFRYRISIECTRSKSCPQTINSRVSILTRPLPKKLNKFLQTTKNQNNNDIKSTKSIEIDTNLFVQTEENPMIVEDGWSMETEEIDGGVNCSGLQEPSDLADDESGVVRGRRRRRCRRGIFDQVFQFGEFDYHGV